ncbi:organic solute transporter Ostalpha-domain-containing protein [Obelidium mucronatum]|nr:organic solute transporter Ostalpha-domain-containing protein [Obelidium mucronatum]
MFVSKTPKDNPSTIDPGSGFDFAHPKSLFKREAASWAWIVTAVIALLATLLSGILIFKHLRNFNRPLEQVHIVRILLFVPVYALVSWLAFRYYWRAVYIFTVRDCYEAFVIYSFYALILQFLGPTVHVQNMALQTKKPMPYPIWGALFKNLIYNPASPTFLKRNKLLVMQYVVVRPVMTVVALVMQVTSRFCSESMSPMYGHFWYSVVNFVSVSGCMYGLVVLYFTIKDDVAVYRPLPKFLSIKIVIFLTMVQNMVLSTLAPMGKLPETEYWTETNIANGIQSFLVCCEMLVAAVFHMSAFSSKEYETGAGRVHTSWSRALVRSFNPIDIFRELGGAVTHVAHEVNVGRGGGGSGKPLDSSYGKATTIVEEEVLEEEEIVIVSDRKNGYGTHS